MMTQRVAYTSPFSIFLLRQKSKQAMEPATPAPTQDYQQRAFCSGTYELSNTRSTDLKSSFCSLVSEICYGRIQGSNAHR